MLGADSNGFPAAGLDAEANGSSDADASCDARSVWLSVALSVLSGDDFDLPMAAPVKMRRIQVIK